MFCEDVFGVESGSPRLSPTRQGIMHVLPAPDNAMYNACAMDMDMAPGSRCCIGSDTFLPGPEPMIESGNEAPGQYYYVHSMYVFLLCKRDTGTQVGSRPPLVGPFPHVWVYISSTRLLICHMVTVWG